MIKRANKFLVFLVITVALGAGATNAQDTTVYHTLPGTSMITLQTASVNGKDHQILVFSWLDEEGNPIHQAVDISN